MRYGIYFAYWEKYWNAELLPYISKVRKLGFDILEISCASLKTMSKTDMDALRDEAKKEGIILTAGYGPNAAENLASSDPAIQKNAIAFYTDMLKKLEYLDIHTICGGIYSYWPVDYSNPIDKEGDWARSVKNVKTVSQIAGDCGVNYCLEVLNRFEGYLLNTAEEAVRFVKEVDEPAARVHLDTFHANIEEDSLIQAIFTAGSYLGHFHVGENNRRLPGKGTLPWGEIGHALRQIGYTGDVVMEPFVLRGGEVGENIKIWRDLCHDETTLDADAAASVAFLRTVFSGPYSDYSV